jgi:hypothetical protein
MSDTEATIGRISLTLEETTLLAAITLTKRNYSKTLPKGMESLPVD